MTARARDDDGEPVTDVAVHEWQGAHSPPLRDQQVHVWRIRLDREPEAHEWAVLDDGERARAHRFFADRHRTRFVVAHGALRRTLAYYTDTPAHVLRFSAGEFGKPSLVVDGAGSVSAPLEFNLSHSGDLALLAVSRGRPVGIDVERWKADVEHLELAERFFSPLERAALRQLGGSPAQLSAGFFAAWSRKEAYLKANGYGITRGLHHFDVSLLPGERARLIRDRLDRGAESRWIMAAIPVGEGYSAALVAAFPVEEILLFDTIEM